ncbi:MAG: hypothetical protein SW833_25955 [Cyanobacteriota bacterium]|nr:hypothetical protein [Cyanobacteriota bacterium]
MGGWGDGEKPEMFFMMGERGGYYITVRAVGGLEMVGFAENSDLLLVVSLSGRGLFDCTSGEKIARDRDDDDLAWYDWDKLSASGIGSLEGRKIRLAGLYGGGLITITRDGWQLDLIAPTWPDYRVILCPPHADIYDDLAACVQVEQDCEIRAFGFSETGRSFIVALNHSLYIYARSENVP